MLERWLKVRSTSCSAKGASWFGYQHLLLASSGITYVVHRPTRGQAFIHIKDRQTKTFNPSTQEQKQADLYEFQVSRSYETLTPPPKKFEAILAVKILSQSGGRSQLSHVQVLPCETQQSTTWDTWGCGCVNCPTHTWGFYP